MAGQPESRCLCAPGLRLFFLRFLWDSPLPSVCLSFSFVSLYNLCFLI